MIEWSKAAHLTLHCSFSVFLCGQDIYTTLCNSEIPLSSVLLSTVTTATVCAKDQIWKCQWRLTLTALSAPAKHWLLKSCQHLFFCSGLGTSSQNGWLWHDVTHRSFLPLVKQQFLQFSPLCHLAPLQIPPSAVGMLPEGIKSHNQFSHPLLSYYTFFLLKGQSTSSDCF